MILTIKVSTPTGTAFEKKVDEIYVDCLDGPLGILPGHTPFMSPLKEEGRLRLVFSDHEELYEFRGGVLDIRPEAVLVLTSYISPVK